MRAFWMSMILSSVGALGPSHAQASRFCEDIFGSEYALNGRVKVESSALQGPRAEEYATTVQKIDSLLNGLKIPTETNIVIHDQMMFSSFNAMDSAVYVGLRPGNVMGRKHPKINMITLTHEYGHAILEKNLGSAIPEFTAFSKKQFDNSNDRDPQLILHTALHELFADSVTLVATKNPEALTELLSMRRKSKKQLQKEFEHLQKTAEPDDVPFAPEEQMPLSGKYSREQMSLRSMSHGYDHLQYKKWKEMIGDEFVRMDPYFILLPARWHLWQAVKTRIESPNYQQAILKKVFPLIKSEMESVIQHAPESLTVEGIEALNQRLMRQLDEVLF